MNIKVCVSLPSKTIDEAVRLVEKAEAQNADLIEIRLDSLKKHDKLIDITQSSNLPFVATNKSTKNHGSFSGNEEDCQRVLMNAARNGFQYVDVDLYTPNTKEIIDNLREVGVKPIVSFHDFNKTPIMSKLNEVLEQEIEAGAAVCKIVTTANHIEDNLATLNLVSAASKKTKIVCFAIGELGKPSRLLSPVFGAFFTFASIDEKRKTAKGQLTIQEITQAYEALGLK